MNVEIRPITKSELDEYRRVATTALLMPPEVLPPEAIYAVQPEITLCAFENSKLTTSYAWWPLKLYINGAATPVAGITFVGTLPVYRRRGYLRQVIRKHFQIIQENGWQPITALYASQAAIYQRYGYGIVSTRNAYEIAPRDLIFAHSDNGRQPPVQVRELDENDIDKAKALYNTFCADRTGYLVRKDVWWAGGPLRTPDKNETLCKIGFEENGALTGYAIYTIAPRKVAHGQPWQHIAIRDYAWLTPAAYRAIWEHFATMDLAAKVGCLQVPTDDPLPHLLLEPRRLNISSGDGLLARIVDVKRAIPKREYDEAGELTFQLIDALCPWNEGQWKMTVADQKAEVQSSSGKPEVVMPVDTLAMIMFGQISPTQAVRMGRAEADDPSILPKWDRIMGTRYRPFCADFF